jgi:membrane-associated PAP2 superfamily phosphatase
MHEVQARPIRLLDRRTGALLSCILMLAAPAIAWLGQFSDIDLRLADMLFDAQAKTFPWRHAWLAETFNHVVVKQLCMLAAVGFVGVAVLDLFRPSPRRSALDRLRLRVVALSAVLVPLTIGMIKQASVSHCPWDLARYGGEQPYFRLFDALPAGVAAGHCMPAGHASSALWLVALAVYWLPAPARGARQAALAALAALAFGAASGWLQQMRGAHFLTHTLWSMWISCAIVLGLMLALQMHAAGALFGARRARFAARRLHSHAGMAPAPIQYEANTDARNTPPDQ